MPLLYAKMQFDLFLLSGLCSPREKWGMVKCWFWNSYVMKFSSVYISLLYWLPVNRQDSLLQVFIFIFVLLICSEDEPSLKKPKIEDEEGSFSIMKLAEGNITSVSIFLQISLLKWKINSLSLF